VLDLRQLRGPIPPDEATRRVGLPTPRAILRERPALGKVMLHVDSRGVSRRGTPGLGLPEPVPADGFAAATPDLSILSVTRDAYLLVTPPNGQYGLIQRLRPLLVGSGAAITDVSSGYAAFRLQGPAANELLYRGCSTPLDAPHFTTGQCMTTRVGKIAVIIHRFDDAPGFDMYVTRSLALAFWTWLIHVGRDCGQATSVEGSDGTRCPGAGFSAPGGP